MQVSRAEGDGGIPVLRLEGDFDTFEAADVRRQLEEVITEESPSVILDLGAMTFANSTTIACFISSQKRARDLRGQLGFAAPREFFRKTLQTLGLNQVFPIFDTVEEAQEKLGG
ncbi:MAG: STAS domain-containing protein [Planctomycetota bacterium]